MSGPDRAKPASRGRRRVARVSTPAPRTVLHMPDAKETSRLPSTVEPAPRRTDPVVHPIARLGQSIGNRNLANLIQQDRLAEPGVQRWASLGEEFYESPPHTPDGTGVIAGVPNPGEGDVVTESNPVQLGDDNAAGQLRGESEWRELLTRGGNHAAEAVYTFLRAAVLDDEEWLQHVERNYDGNPAQERLLTGVGTGFVHAFRRIRRPTEREQMALAKAIYLRGRTSIAIDLDQYAGMGELMERFMARHQPTLLANMAASNVRFGHEHVAPVTRAGGEELHATMVGSAAGSLTRAIGEFAAWDEVKRAAPDRSPERADAEHRKMLSLREAEMAGQLLRGVADEAAAIRREEIETWKTVISVAIQAIPIPGVGKFVTQSLLRLAEGQIRDAVSGVLDKLVDTLATDRIKDGLASAFAQDDQTQRVEGIRTEAVWLVREFELGDEEDDVVNTINATLMGAGG